MGGGSVFGTEKSVVRRHRQQAIVLLRIWNGETRAQPDIRSWMKCDQLRRASTINSQCQRTRPTLPALPAAPCALPPEY